MAAKRWLEQSYRHFSDHSLTYLGDDLFANQPLCQLIAETYRQCFIFVCKPESHTGLYEWIEFLGQTQTLENVTHRHWNGKHTCTARRRKCGELWQYRFAAQVPLRHGAQALSVNYEIAVGSVALLFIDPLIVFCRHVNR